MRYLLIWLICMYCCVVNAQDYYHLNRVIDGMTLSLVSSNYKDTLNVKLNGIKTPLLRQGYGHSVREYVVKALSNKRLQIINDIEYLNIKYVEILIDSKILFNLKMLKDGWAWYDSSILKNNDYDKAESYAKRNNLGLWYYDVKKPWSLY